MKKNTGSQQIGAQMITATDGTAFTGAVTVYRTIDGGTQALGDTGSGACTHEGNGYHSYVVAATDCNGDHIAFTFIGSGAIPATLQVYTEFPQTGDTYALANGSAGFVAIDTVVDSILAHTGTDGVKLNATQPSGWADNLVKSAGTIVKGTASGVPSTTTMPASDLASTVDDFYNGRIIIWTSGALTNQATDITDYTGSTKTLTFTAVTGTGPSASDTFIIV